MSSSLVVRDYTIKCEEEVGCLEFKPRPCINYAMSLSTKINFTMKISEGNAKYFSNTEKKEKSE